jgi:hypothetical protein
LLCQVLDAPQRPAEGVPGGLTARPAELMWAAFTADLAPVNFAPAVPGVDPLWRNNVIGEMSASEVPAWERLHLAVAATSGLVIVHGLAAFQFWAPTVRRFSYALLTRDTDA